jgi:hypothetical protein
MVVQGCDRADLKIIDRDLAGAVGKAPAGIMLRLKDDPHGLGVPVAAGVLYPTLGLLLSPMIAAAAMGLSSVSVIANALRLRGAKLD